MSKVNLKQQFKVLKTRDREEWKILVAEEGADSEYKYPGYRHLGHVYTLRDGAVLKVPTVDGQHNQRVRLGNVKVGNEIAKLSYPDAVLRALTVAFWLKPYASRAYREYEAQRLREREELTAKWNREREEKQIANYEAARDFIAERVELLADKVKAVALADKVDLDELYEARSYYARAANLKSALDAFKGQPLIASEAVVGEILAYRLSVSRKPILRLPKPSPKPTVEAVLNVLEA